MKPKEKVRIIKEYKELYNEFIKEKCIVCFKNKHARLFTCSKKCDQELAKIIGIVGVASIIIELIENKKKVTKHKP